MMLAVEETIPKTWWETRDVIYFQEVCMCSWNSILECTAGDYGGNVPAAIMWCVTQLFISVLLLVQFRHAVD